MGKGADLWDDSALINAFDAAISKYKMMHGMKSQSTLIENECSPEKESVSEKFDERYENTRNKGEHCDTGSNATQTDRRENINVSTAEGNNYGVHEPYMNDPNVDLHRTKKQEEFQEYSNSQGFEDYNQLLKKYYELEEQRQKVLEQLYQYNSNNLGMSDMCTDGRGVNPGPCSTSQAHQIPACHTSLPTAFCSCCPYICPYMVGSCTAIPYCSLCGPAGVAKNCVDPSMTADDDNIVNSAVGVAERAIFSIKEKVTGETHSNEGIEKDSGINEGNAAQHSSSETDIDVVFSAWYRAGFYTGKYLTEQQFKSKKKPAT